MTAIPFPLSSSPGHVDHTESAGRLINCYAEPLGEGRGAKRVRAPGFFPFFSSTQSGFRGMFIVGSTLYAAFATGGSIGGGSLWTGFGGGGPLQRLGGPGPGADLPGEDAVCYFARNNRLTAGAPTPDKVVVTAGHAYVITDTEVVIYPDADLPQTVNSVFALDGYLVFTTPNGRAYATELNALEVNSLSFGQAEAKTDGLIRGIPFSGRAHFFGTQSLEIWVDVGASPFPFQRSVVVPFGLIGPDAVAGWEDGFGSGLLWVADDFSVRVLNGYTAVKVSPPDLDRLLARDPDRLKILANVYVVDGHPMWTVTGTDYSWSFDLNTQKWHERRSWRRRRVEDGSIQVEQTRWRAKQSLRAFNKWLVGDDISGSIHEIDPRYHREFEDPLVARIESGPVAQFPARIRVARADFNMETGVGEIGPLPLIGIDSIDPLVEDPTVSISWSDDGGSSWSTPLIRKLGQLARAEKRVTVLRTGMSTQHGRRWRLEVADPVYVSIISGDQSAELRR
jgi:hypothetical protein